VADRAEALARLRPGLDGLSVEDGTKRALFLPAVWDLLPDPETFIRHLMEKAGLPPNHWSATLRLKRFSSRSLSAPLGS
jgi:AMMECR1 domain-containing protein